MYKLVSVNKGFLEAFNEYYASEYVEGQLIKEEDKKALISEIGWFNQAVAEGEAVWLEKV